MNPNLRQYVTLVRAEFDGVARRLGLRGPDIDGNNTYFRIGYFGDAIGLQILVEVDSFFMYAYLFRSTGTDRLSSGLVADDGKRRKMLVQTALDHLRVRYNENQTLQRLGGDHRNCSAMTSVLAHFVERSWPLLVANVDRLFPQDG